MITFLHSPGHWQELVFWAGDKEADPACLLKHNTLQTESPCSFHSSI